MQFNYLLQSDPGGSLGSTLIMMALIFVIFYFFLIRPQRKKEKETQKMIAALKKGDKVVTIGGIHGTVSSTKEHTVLVKVDDGCKIEFSRSAIANVIVDKAAEAKAEKKAAKEKKESEEKPAETIEAPAEEKSETTSTEEKK